MVISLRRRIHIDQLARPPKHKITKKFDPEAERLAQSVNCLPSIQSIRGKRTNYRISERLKDLARPIIRSTDMFFNADPYNIRRDVLKYKATPRIIELSQPRDRDSWEYQETRPCDYLNYPYQATARTLELAQPRDKISQWRYNRNDDY